jgi:hypothetical protein
MIILKVKSRLSMEAARELAEYFNDAVANGKIIVVDESIDIIEVDGHDLQLYIHQLGDA